MNKILVMTAAMMLAACTRSAPTTPTTDTSTAATVAQANTGRTLNLAIWSNFLSPTMVEEFTQKTGIKVTISNYASNEELLAKLQAGASGYDVIVPSDYIVFAMIKLNLLEKLDAAKVPSLKAIAPHLLKKNYDTDNSYSVPFDWGTTGLAINHAVYPGKVAGWKDLFANAALKGKYTLMDDGREVLAIGLKLNQQSLNSKDPAVVAKAKAEIAKVRKSIKGFTSESKMPLINGEVAVAHAYSSDALQAAKETGGKVEYVIPAEGATLWIDNLSIPKGAAHTAEAYEFINFVLDAKNVAARTQAIFVGPVRTDTIELLPPDLRGNTSLFPTPETLKRLEMMEDLGDAMSIIDRNWTELKAQ